MILSSNVAKMPDGENARADQAVKTRSRYEHQIDRRPSLPTSASETRSVLQGISSDGQQGAFECKFSWVSSEVWSDQGVVQTF